MMTGAGSLCGLAFIEGLPWQCFLQLCCAAYQMRKRLPHSQIIVVPTPFLPGIVPLMSKPPDLEALARRYVELWQDQIAATAVDPELTDGLARMMQLVGGGFAAQAGLWQSLWPDLAARA